MKKIIKNVFTEINHVKSDDIISVLKNKKINTVSFDVFDTLIKRNVRNPEDVFLILEKEFNNKFDESISISEIRKDAEKKANRQYEFPSIENIYENFSMISDVQKRWLLNRELEIELEVCQKNLVFYEIYKWCINNNKKIIIISDMYLHTSQVEKILKNSGYDIYDAIYVSCDVNSSKAVGNIYNLVKSEQKLSYKNWVHIGDAQKGDFINPKSKGISSILIKINENETTYLNKKFLTLEKKKKELSYNIINSFIKNNIKKDFDFYQEIGYEVIGPLLFGYSKWLNKEIKKENISEVLFLAREGNFLLKAFELVQEESINSRVIRVSRKATSVPLLRKANSLNDLLSLINVKKANFKVKDFLNSCGLSTDFTEQVVKKAGLQKNKVISKLNGEEKKRLFNFSKRYIDIISKKQLINIKGYLNLPLNQEKVAVCDVGWHGTIQEHLQSIYPRINFSGYYIGTKKKTDIKKNQNHLKGYLFDDNKNLDIQSEIMSAPDVFELFFLSTDGTTISYENIDGEFVPVQARPEQTKESAEEIIKLQNAALEFIKDFEAFYSTVGFEIDPKCCAAAYSSLINPPSMKFINEMGDFSFRNVGVHSMLPEHSLVYYIFNPNKFKEEFLNNGSKIIFLKKLFKIPLPYVKLLSFLRKFDR